MDEMNRHVVPLDELSDFKVADGDPDVRGWEVISADRRKIGEVEDLLIDTAAMKVRYLDVDVDDELIPDGDDRHILIPIGYARLDGDERQIFVDQLSSSQVVGLPVYGNEPLTRDWESDLRRHFDTDFTTAGAATTAAATQPDFYESNLYDQDRFYGRTGQRDDETRLTLSEEELSVGKRQVRAGEVEVEKHVETEHVRETVPVRHEEVVVERRPATPGMSGRAEIGEDEIRVPIMEEQLVVEKRTVPVEEVVVRKREVVENETVEADLRRERADIHRDGDVDLREDR